MHLPSLPFLPASTVCSTVGLAGLFRPASGRGVRAVSNPISLSPHCCDGWSLVSFSGPPIVPFEAFPSATAALCHHSRCPLAVVRHHCFQQRRPRPQGFAPSRSPSPRTDVAINTGLDAPLGFVPLQGSPLIFGCPHEVLLSHPAKAASL